MKNGSSPFSVGWRKPQYIFEDDPRAKTQSKLNAYTANIGKEVVIVPKQKSTKANVVRNAPTDLGYWLAVYGFNIDINYNPPIYFSQGDLVFKKGYILFNGARTRMNLGNDKFIKHMTIKTDFAGNRVWEKISVSEDYYGSYYYSAIDNNEDFYKINSISGYNEQISKYDKNGETLFGYTVNDTYQYSGSLYYPGFFSIQVTPNNDLIANYFRVQTGASIIENIIFKANSDGTSTIYAHVPQGPGASFNGSGGEANKTAVDLSGNVYLAGRTQRSSSSALCIILFKYNSSLDLQWQKVIVGDGTAATEGFNPVGIKTDNQGNLYIYGSNIDKGFIIKVSPSGSILWQKEIIGPYSNQPIADISIDANNNVYLLYGVGGSGLSLDYLIKINSLGDTLWQRSFSSGIHGIDCYSDSIFINGQISELSSFPFLIGKIPTDGSMTGTTTFSINNFDYDVTYSEASISITNTSFTTQALDFAPASSNPLSLVKGSGRDIISIEDDEDFLAETFVIKRSIGED